jgi:flagellar hook capping protein FlgD
MLTGSMKRSFAVIVVLALAIGLLTATPALAIYSVSPIQLPNNTTTFYSPFSGPAEITFNFNDFQDLGTNDPPATFNLRLRVQNGPTVYSENVSINPSSQLSPRTIEFDWPAVSVTSPTIYEVAVFRGGDELRDRAFTLKPPLARITSIAPDPFLPWIDDDYKDTTDVTFKLASTSEPVIVRVFKSDTDGTCCGPLVREADLATQVVGTRHFVWNGRDGGGDLLPKGRYWVRITATDFGGITRTSTARDVSIARFYRARRTVAKNGIAYHHRSTTTVLAAGGTCNVQRLTVPKDVGIRCDDARVRVFWRWSLPSSGEIESASFVMVDVPGACHTSKGHTLTDTFLAVGGLGANRCRVDKARMTYSFLKAS